MLEWMGLNFYYYDGLQPKIRAGIINEHECIRCLLTTIADTNPANVILGNQGMVSLVAKIEYVSINSNWTQEIMTGPKKKLGYSEETL